MKIITPGTPPAKIHHWWVGRIIKCGACACEYQLEESDEPDIAGERHVGGSVWINTECPTCMRAIRSYKF